MIHLSTALRAAMATEYGLARMMRLGCIKIFSGPQPEGGADAAEQGDWLATITQDGADWFPGYTAGGLNLRAGPVAGACQNDGAWVLKARASGTAGWWRFVWNSLDTGQAMAEDYTPRIDGLVGEGLVLPSNVLSTGQVTPIESFFFFIPPSN